MAKGELDSVHRGWARRLASTGRIGATAAHLAARRLIGAEGEADGKIGEALAKELDQMKGMAMKMGQILSYFEGVLPEDTHRALQSLQRGASHVAFASMAAAIEEALGAAIPDLYEDFIEEPIASASIGQIYRARFEGEPVAVKVQYPGIRETIASDFSRLKTIAGLASLATAVDGQALVTELRERFVEECDYRVEAKHQTAFRAAFETDPGVRIPRVFAARSAETVLTSEWCDGQDFYAFVEGASAAQKSEVGLTLARFALRCLFELQAINADPHPGNYLFPKSGPTVFLDFGCVRRFERSFVEAHRRLVLAVIDDRRADFKDAVIATGVAPRPERFDFDFHWKMLCHEYAAYRAPRFRFTSDHVRQGMAMNGPSNPNGRRMAVPPPWIWVERLQWGLHAVLARLGAEGPFGDVLREATDSPPSPLFATSLTEPTAPVS